MQMVKIHSKQVADNTNSVNARELHSFLEVKKIYANWIKDRISKYGFIENQDYIIIETKKQGNNATLKEYYITLDMAKELAMVENNEKGREARQYFIKVDKEHHSGQTDLKQIILTQNTTIALLQTQLESKPKQIENRHPRSKLPPLEHNNFIELVFQMIEQKRDIAKFKKVLTERENNMQNFLNGFVRRYPEVKEYVEKYNT